MAASDYSHVEIPADDPERAKRFYSELFGWQFQEVAEFPDYHMFQTAERRGGAIGKRGETAGNVLRLYITVPSIDDAIAKAEQNGGSVVVPRTEVPGQGDYAAVKDPEGNEIGLWQDPPAS